MAATHPDRETCDLVRAFDHAFPPRFRGGDPVFEFGPHEGATRDVDLSGPMDDGLLRFGPVRFVLCESHIRRLKEYDQRFMEARRGAQSTFGVRERHD